MDVAKHPGRNLCTDCYRTYKAAYRKPESHNLGKRKVAEPETDRGKQVKRSKFLEALLSNGGFVEAAIREVHTSRRFINESYNEDEAFARLFDTILDVTNERIEQEIYRRAVTGVDKELSYQGKLTGHKTREYSDNLLIFLAKARMPQKYRDQAQKGAELSDEELNAQLAKYLAKRGNKMPELASEAVQ